MQPPLKVGNGVAMGIVVDKGFLIDDVCGNFNIRLIRPPFLQNKKQFTTKGS